MFQFAREVWCIAEVSSVGPEQAKNIPFQLYSTVLYCTVLGTILGTVLGTVLYCTVLCFALLHSTLLYFSLTYFLFTLNYFAVKLEHLFLCFSNSYLILFVSFVGTAVQRTSLQSLTCPSSMVTRRSTPRNVVRLVSWLSA